MRVFIFSNLLREFPYKSFTTWWRSFWKLRNHKYSHIELGPPVISHRQLAGSPRQDVDHGTMFEHGRPWLDRVVWPWCVISPWPWYIANHNGNKVNYCFLLSQWKHITAHNNFIFSNKLLEMHWVKATPNHGRPSPILSPTQLQSNPTNRDIEGTERRVRIREVSV